MNDIEPCFQKVLAEFVEDFNPVSNVRLVRASFVNSDSTRKQPTQLHVCLNVRYPIHTRILLRQIAEMQQQKGQAGRRACTPAQDRQIDELTRR